MPGDKKIHQPVDSLLGRTTPKGAEYNTDSAAVTQQESSLDIVSTPTTRHSLGDGVVVEQDGAFTHIRIGNGKATISVSQSGQVTISTNSSAGIVLNSPSGKVVVSAPAISFESNGPLTLSGSNVEIIGKKGISFKSPAGHLSMELAAFSADIAGNMFLNVGKDFGAVFGGSFRQSIAGTFRQQVARDFRLDVGGIQKMLSRGEMILNTENAFNLYAGKSSSLNSLQDISLVTRGNTNLHSNQSLNMKIGNSLNGDIKGNVSLKSNGNYNLDVQGNVVSNSNGETQISAKGQMVMKADGDMKQSAGGVMHVYSSGRMDVDSGNEIHMMEGGAARITANNAQNALPHSGVVDKGDEVSTPKSAVHGTAGSYAMTDSGEYDNPIPGNEFSKATQAPEPVDTPSEQEIIEKAGMQTHLKTKGKDPYNATRRTNERGGRMLNKGASGDDRNQKIVGTKSEQYIRQNTNNKQIKKTNVT